MSIEARAGSFSRSVRTLITSDADELNEIKDLKDLRAFRCAGVYRHLGPTDLKSQVFISS